MRCKNKLMLEPSNSPIFKILSLFENPHALFSFTFGLERQFCSRQGKFFRKLKGSQTSLYIIDTEE